MSKFNVGDKVRFIEDYTSYFVKGKVVVVTGFWSDGIDFIDETGEKGGALYSRFELVESKQAENQRITALEETVAKQGEEISELKLIVEQLRKSNITIQDVEAHFGVESPSLTVEDIIEFDGKQYRKVDREAREGDVVITSESTEFITKNKPYKVQSHGSNLVIGEDADSCVFVYNCNRTPETVDVYELITQDVQRQTVECESQLPFDDVEDLPYEPTPNELRAEVIEKAKQFVIENIANQPGSMYEDLNLFAEDHWYETEFIIKGNRVTALIFTLTGMNERSIRPKRVGRADCTEGDVFNSHIGKAIALGRALGMDVSEFEQVVQPTEFVEGQIIEGSTGMTPEIHKNQTCYGVEGNDVYTDELKYGWLYAPHTKIINDTNAIYGGVE